MLHDKTEPCERCRIDCMGNVAVAYRLCRALAIVDEQKAAIERQENFLQALEENADRLREHIRFLKSMGPK